MKQYYTEGGFAVWTGGDIPFHITNTPLLAAEWADSIFAMMRDFHRQGKLHPEHPIEVFELGPGTGRHAFFLLRELERLEEQSRLLHPDGYRFTLQLAELGSKGLETLSQHCQLQPYLKDGRLLLSQFDIATDATPVLWPSGLSRETPSPNPVFVVANYVMDSLPYDVVRYRHNEPPALGLAKVVVKGLEEGQDPRALEELGERIDLSFTFESRPACFSRPHWNEVLERYDTLDGTHLPFPTGAMNFLEHLRTWSQSASVLFVADKSFVTLAQLQCLDEPELVPHGGGFSFNANLHAMGYLAQTWGGTAWHTTPRDGTLDLSHVVLPAVGQEGDSFAEMDLRCRQLDRFHAIDRFRIKESVDLQVRRPRLRLAVDLLTLSGHDPQVFYDLSDHILRGLDDDDCDEETEAELLTLLPGCLEAVFPIGDDVDMAFEIGRVAYRLELYELSEKAFQLSIAQFGDDPKAHFNLGLGWYYEKRWAESEGAFEKALSLDAGYEDAEDWLKKVRYRARS